MTTPLLHDPSALRLGRAPARHDGRTLRLASYLAADLPAPPPQTNRARGMRHPMFSNDVLGDCTAATAGHLLRFWAHQTKRGRSVRITNKQVVAFYSASCGYDPADPATDQGGVELDVLRAWRTDGLAGHRIGAFASVQTGDPAAVRQATWLFDGTYLGVLLATAQQEQPVWDYVPGAAGTPGSWGGHAVPIVDYNSVGPVVVTWGEAKQTTWRFFGEQCDEAWAVLSPEQLAVNGRTAEGLDAAALRDDLAHVASPVT